MKKVAKTESGTRSPLTRELVLREAVTILDEGGIEALSMRRLGSSLGVEAMSLYNHVASKDELIDGALELVAQELSVPGEDTGWREAMHARAISAWRVFSKHPWAGALMDSRLSASPARLRYFNAVLGALERAGFSLELAARAFSVLDCYVYGFGRQRLNMAASGASSQESSAQAFRELIPGEAYPHLARMAEWTIEHGYDEAADFEFGLGLVLDGLERLLQPATRRAKEPGSSR